VRSKFNLTTVSAKIGTAKEFLDHVYSDRKSNSFPIKTGDMMPYISLNNEAWSGFYTSRPYFKQKLRNLKEETRASGLIYGLEALKTESSKFFHHH
jgi:hypothetical protein